jgi:hypothetical protein
MIAALALCAYLVTAVGLPLPANVNKGSAPFPCQHHACGCATAHQCWDHCCCYSATEKLTWAREHHVTPPARLVAEVAAIEAAPLLSSSKSSRPPHACCAKHQSPEADHDHANEPHESADCHEHEARAVGVKFVLGVQALKCRGLSEFWCLTGAVLPPPNAVGWQFQWNVVGWLALAATPLNCGDLSPPVPPPKV